jgi:GNAT superfamily N-acetyltransferase
MPGALPLLTQLGYPCHLDVLKTRFVRFLENPCYGVAVCEMNAEVLGLVAWSKSDLFVSDTVRFHIEALIVSARHRGKGIGKKLMAWVERVAQQHAPAVIDLTSGLRRASDGSHAFYKRLGYHNDGPMAKLYLRKELCA